MKSQITNLNDRNQQNKKNWYEYILRVYLRRIIPKFLQYKPTDTETLEDPHDVGKMTLKRNRPRWPTLKLMMMMVVTKLDSE
jgi:hypothetical protein